jgi:hypothetical protein
MSSLVALLITDYIFTGLVDCLVVLLRAGSDVCTVS